MNAAEKLSREVERVTTIKAHFEELRSMPNVIVEPQIIIMQASLERAHKAAGSNDPLQVMQAIGDLEGYSE